MIQNRKLTPEEKALKRFNVKYFDSIFTPVGHLLSVLVEELEIKKPNLSILVSELNEYIEIGGNGHAKVQNPSKRTEIECISYGSKAHNGLINYLLYLSKKKKISKKRTNEIYHRINDEIRGIIPEDRFE